MANQNPERSQTKRLHNKTLGLLQRAVKNGDIVSCSYDPQTQEGFTYFETDGDQEVTVHSNGSVHISTGYYPSQHGVDGLEWFSFQIEPGGNPGNVLGIYQRLEDGKVVQVTRDVPRLEQERLASLLLADMFDGTTVHQPGAEAA